MESCCLLLLSLWIYHKWQHRLTITRSKAFLLLYILRSAILCFIFTEETNLTLRFYTPSTVCYCFIEFIFYIQYMCILLKPCSNGIHFFTVRAVLPPPEGQITLNDKYVFHVIVLTSDCIRSMIFDSNFPHIVLCLCFPFFSWLSDFQFLF